MVWGFLFINFGFYFVFCSFLLSHVLYLKIFLPLSLPLLLFFSSVQSTKHTENATNFKLSNAYIRELFLAFSGEKRKEISWYYD